MFSITLFTYTTFTTKVALVPVRRPESVRNERRVAQCDAVTDDFQISLSPLLFKEVKKARSIIGIHQTPYYRGVSPPRGVIRFKI